MIASELILPTRFYNDLFNQFRFDKDCDYDPCGSGFVYPTNKLPHFQIKRDASETEVGRVMLRNVCCDADLNFYKNIPQNASIFASSSDSYWNLPANEFEPAGGGLPVEVDISELSCGKLKSLYFDPNVWVSTGNFPELTGITTGACWVRLKIVVDKIQRAPGSTMEIRVYNNFTYNAITDAGVYTFDFLSDGAPFIQFANYAAGDMFEISEIQVQTLEIDCHGSCDTDVTLDEDKVTIYHLQNETDRLVYCEQSSNYDIQPGNYYYYIKCVGEDESVEFYYSEVFKIVSVSDIQKYYRLQWWNTCDIEDKIIYNQTTLNCFFYNQLFLDAGLFKPEYPTLRDIEEDGAGNTTETFKKWSKNKTLDIVAPEFIIDALSAVFIHDNIRLQDPLNKMELQQTPEYTIDKIENDNSPVFEDCAQRMGFKFLVEATFTNTRCCETIPMVEPGS